MAPRIPTVWKRALRHPPALGNARSYATKEPNVTAQFYKTFTRPIAKVLLGAVFTYQVVYWTWVKLETDEIRAEKAATIDHLEAKVADYRSKTTEASGGAKP